MPHSHPITIAGGGLAGLALGRLLARAGVDVTLHESGRLPRHRVCGEFICGLRRETKQRLDLEPLLQGAVINRLTGWYADGKERFLAELPAPALGLSRRTLEERLLGDFVSAGGHFLENSRVREPGPEENEAGRIWTAGRRADPAGQWIGLKIHCRNLTLGQDLELHLGNDGYAGASRIEDGRVNICGLFRTRSELRVPRESLLIAYLEACGMSLLATRIAAADPDPASATAVSGLDFSREFNDDSRLSLGDHHAATPPYTGHGMALAFEGAAAAADPLLAYARGEMSWENAANTIRLSLKTRVSRRLNWARRLHPWLLRPTGRRAMLALASANLLPFNLLFRATHVRD